MQGFGHIYDSFFGCYLFAVGALIAYMSRRKKEELVAAALVIAVTCFGAFIMITPSLLYWHQHGKSAIPEYKFAGDSEVYGLKVRHLLTPNREHPIGIFREVADKLDKARFPNENENATSRLGSVGALGFVFLVCWGLAGMVSGGQVGRPVVRASAALTFGAVLLATVGGLSSIFAALVSPEVRGYNRIVVFISFFCLTAFAPLLSRGFVWLKQHRADGITLACLAGGFAVLGVVDEAAPAQYLDYHGRRATWAADEKFVSSIEAQLPPNSMVFQLPHTDFPVEAQLPGKMQMYDQARPYIHSKTLRWSWGGFPGRQGEWSRSIAGLPPERMLIALSCAGFSGIWIDEFGYPPGASPLRQLMAATSQSPMWNPENRIAFIDIRGYRDKFMASLSEEQRVQVSRAALLEPVGVRFESFDGEEVDGARRWRWCPKTCAITLDNPTEIPKNVLLSATLQTGTPAAQEVDVKGPGFADAVLVSNATLPYSKTVRIPPKGRVSVTMSTDAPPVLPPPARTMRLAVQNLIIEEERWDPVRPAKSDGPTAVASGSVKLSFENFDVEEVDGARRWRWCPRTCAVTLYNPAELPKTVLLSATLQTGTPAAQEVDVKGPGFANAVLVSNATLPYSKTVRIPPKGRISVTMSTDAPPVLPPPARTMRLAVQNLTVTEKF
jgi:phosphoglycerol transferase